MKEPRIIYEDAFFLVVDKPAGMVVNRASSVGEEKTIQDWIESRPEWKGQQLDHNEASVSYFVRRSGVVHRLDKETSGVMVIAKTAATFSHLLQQFATRQVKKTYIALVHGLLQPKQGIVRLPLARCRQDRQRFSVAVSGKLAETSWQVIRFYQRCVKPDLQTKGYQGFSLLEVEPQTGRTHQIRVHFSFLGYPVVGDERYAGRKSRLDRQWCPRQFLHAKELDFIHPVSAKRVEFNAKLPDDLRAALSFLE